MRIYCAIRHSTDPERYYSALWTSNFYPALRRLGHEIVESTVDLEDASDFMQVAADYTPEERALRGDLTQRIVDEVTSQHRERPIDLFLSYFYNSHFDPAGFERIHALGITTVNFFCNSMYQFELVRNIARAVRYSWHPERDARAAYLAAGARPVWVQMGADPDLCRPSSGILRESAVCFVGQRYADRALWLAALARASVPLRVFGQGWRPAAAPTQATGEFGRSRLGRIALPPGSPAAYERMARANLQRFGLSGGLRRTVDQVVHRFRTARAQRTIAPFACGYATGRLADTFAQYEVNLNLSNVWSDGQPGSRLIPHVRLRDFEVPMACGCLLTGESEEIAELYEVGREIETYREPEELVDKARFLLARPATAERVRQAGLRKALGHHTWVDRFRTLFNAL